jgi:hypothetical protein
VHLFCAYIRVCRWYTCRPLCTLGFTQCKFKRVRKTTPIGVILQGVKLTPERLLWSRYDSFLESFWLFWIFVIYSASNAVFTEVYHGHAVLNIVNTYSKIEFPERQPFTIIIFHYTKSSITLLMSPLTNTLHLQLTIYHRTSKPPIPYRYWNTIYTLITRKYMHAETLALLTKPLYFPNMKF